MARYVSRKLSLESTGLRDDRDDVFEQYRTMLYDRAHTLPDADGCRYEGTLNDEGEREVDEAGRQVAGVVCCPTLVLRKWSALRFSASGRPSGPSVHSRGWR